jgi:hypothetical protein
MILKWGMEDEGKGGKDLDHRKRHTHKRNAE